MLSQDRSQAKDRLVSTPNGSTEMQTRPKAGTELTGKGFVTLEAFQHGTIPSGGRVYQWDVVLPFPWGRARAATIYHLANPPCRLLLSGGASDLMSLDPASE